MNEYSGKAMGIPYPKELQDLYYTFNIKIRYDEYHRIDTLFNLLDDDELAAKRAKLFLIQKYGDRFGQAIINKQVLLGMTIEMVKLIHGSFGNITRNRSELGEVVVLSYGWRHFYTFVNNRLTEYTKPY